MLELLKSLLDLVYNNQQYTLIFLMAFSPSKKLNLKIVYIIILIFNYLNFKLIKYFLPRFFFWFFILNTKLYIR